MLLICNISVYWNIFAIQQFKLTVESGHVTNIPEFMRFSAYDQRSDDDDKMNWLKSITDKGSKMRLSRSKFYNFEWGFELQHISNVSMFLNLWL